MELHSVFCRIQRSQRQQKEARFFGTIGWMLGFSMGLPAFYCADIEPEFPLNFEAGHDALQILLQNAHQCHTAAAV